MRCAGGEGAAEQPGRGARGAGGAGEAAQHSGPLQRAAGAGAGAGRLRWGGGEGEMQAREASVITPSLHCNHRQYSQNAAPPAPRHCPPAELVRKAEEAASLHEAQRSAQSQINLYVAYLQAQQRQLEAAARALRRG